MKIGIVTYPGSNCDRDAEYALSSLLGIPTAMLWHKDRDLKGCDAVLLPGGFSYGDYLRAGAIARFSPIMKPIIEHAEQGGLVLGICNGFQVLTECHLLPGILRMNTCGHFVCQNQYIRPATWQSPLTHALADRPYKIPIAHAEGNFYCDDEELRRLEDEERILFRYCDSEGRRSTGSNPNGSVADIAGICNAGRNVLGLMPHPERAADPLLRNTDGAALLDALRTGVAWGSYVA